MNELSQHWYGKLCLLLGWILFSPIALTIIIACFLYICVLYLIFPYFIFMDNIMNVYRYYFDEEDVSNVCS